MEDLIDLIASDGAPSDVSDRIKELLYAKAADRVDGARPEVSAMMFGENETEFNDGEDDSTGDNE